MIDINRYTLKNGLRIVHHYDSDTKIVVVNMLYKVGAKNDTPGKTGYAHLLEHLMFEGTTKVPDFDEVLQRVGGENNAYTSQDITNYYEILPYQNVETAFWLESDRMVNLCITEENLSVQRNVVAEEFKQRILNRDYADASAIYRKLAYKKHPYRIITIGEKLSHIYDASLSDVKEYYQKYYAPNNAILSVVGNITFSECIRLADKWFGDIDPQQIDTSPLPQEPAQRKARMKRVCRNVPSSNIYKVYHMVSRHHKDYPCFDLISDILSTGKSSRLNHELVQNKKIFSMVDAAITGSVDSGLLIVVGRLAPDVNMEEADKALSAEIAKLSSERVTKRELEKVVNKFESNFLFENIGANELAANIAYYEMLDSDINEEVDKYRKVTPQQIMEVAKNYLKPSNSTTLYYQAEEKV
ncbi:MAG: insulinase family protein [Bacteroidales bacterium]|nr:insulinase family protein [Bacteroidales bacterium]